MPNIMDFKPESMPLKVLIKGAPGTRKTTQASTFPEPIHVIDADNKYPQTVALPRMKGAIPQHTKVTYEHFDKWWKMQNFLENLSPGNLPCGPSGTLIWDSLTITASKILRQMLMKEEKGADGKAKSGKVIGGIKVNTIEDYSGETSALMYMFDILLSMPCNVVVIAHVIGEGSAEQNLMNRLVTGGKSVAAQIPGLFPEIYHFALRGAIDTSKPPDYVMFTQPSSKDFARTTLPLDFEVDLTNRRLYDILKNAQQTMKMK